MREKAEIHRSFLEQLRNATQKTVAGLDLGKLEKRVEAELKPRIGKERVAFEKENEDLLAKLGTAQADLQRGHDERERLVEEIAETLEAAKQKRTY